MGLLDMIVDEFVKNKKHKTEVYKPKDVIN